MQQNRQLFALYESKYTELSENIRVINERLSLDGKLKQRATNPLLLKVTDDYINADIKIMFFGQETNGWLREKNKGEFCNEIGPVLSLYEKFYLSGECFSYGGHFWNGVARFKSLLQKQIPNKTIVFVYNNVLKIGKCGIGFPIQVNKITNK